MRFHTPSSKKEGLKAMRLMTAATAIVLSFASAGLGQLATAPQALAADGDHLKLTSSSIGTTRRIKVGLNKSLVIDLPGDAHDILVANPDVADAVTRTSRRIYIFAKMVGETNIFIFDSAGRQLLSVDLVIERDIKGLETYIEKYVPGSDVTVEMVNDNVILTGTVPTPQASARAVQLAQIFVTGREATTNNYSNNNGVSNSGSGTTIVFGDSEQRQQSQIVNLLQIDGEDQVHLKVTIAEIQRTVVKQLGIDLNMLTSIGDIGFSMLTDNPFLLGKNITNSGAAANWSHGGNSIDAILNALDSAGVMRTLAEPTLTAISGETASFKVGGEYNIADGKEEDDSITYNVKTVEYGVGLTFTPVVLSPGRISLKLRTEVSEPTSEGSFVSPRVDFRGSGQFNGVHSVPAPGIRRREAETTVELPSGGSMVIAGLLKDDVRQTVSGFPGLRKLPILGTLFRSREYERYESELVIIVTPYLVRPTARQALARPDDNFMPASDSAAIFLGQVNRIYGTTEGSLPPGQYNGNPGFIYK